MSDGVRLIGVCLMGCPGGGLSDAVLLMGCPGGGAGSPFLLSSRKRVEEGLKVWGEKMPMMADRKPHHSGISSHAKVF